MLKEKIVDYLYEINARCDYTLEDVADDIVDIVGTEIDLQRKSENRWHNVIGL